MRRNIWFVHFEYVKHWWIKQQEGLWNFVSEQKLIKNTTLMSIARKTCYYAIQVLKFKSKLRKLPIEASYRHSIVKFLLKFQMGRDQVSKEWFYEVNCVASWVKATCIFRLISNPGKSFLWWNKHVVEWRFQETQKCVIQSAVKFDSSRIVTWVVLSRVVPVC